MTNIFKNPLVIGLFFIFISMILAFTLSQTNALQDFIIISLFSCGLGLVTFYYIPDILGFLKFNPDLISLPKKILSSFIIPVIIPFFYPTDEGKQTPQPIKDTEQEATLEINEGSFIPISNDWFDNLFIKSNEIISQDGDMQVRIVYPIGIAKLSKLANSFNRLIEENYDDSRATIYSIGSYKSAFKNQFKDFDNIVHVVFLTNSESSFQDRFINKLSGESDFSVKKLSERDLGDFKYNQEDNIILFLGFSPH